MCFRTKLSFGNFLQPISKIDVGLDSFDEEPKKFCQNIIDAKKIRYDNNLYHKLTTGMYFMHAVLLVQIKVMMERTKNN